jgi:hypothetical protein
VVPVSTPWLASCVSFWCRTLSIPSTVHWLGLDLCRPAGLQTMTKKWNKKISDWLTRYAYIRTGGNLSAVYSLSAFWHGLYPGYYMFFLSVPLATFCDHLAKKKLSPHFSKTQFSLYGISGRLATTITVNSMILSFVMLAASWSWEAWTSHSFFGHIGAITFYFVLSALPWEKPKTA